MPTVHWLYGSASCFPFTLFDDGIAVTSEVERDRTEVMASSSRGMAMKELRADDAPQFAPRRTRTMRA